MSDSGIEELGKNWNALGKKDPMWAVLSLPGKKGNRWDAEEFFATGEREIEYVVKYAGYINPGMGKERALDFGCGVGRLTQALAAHFDEVHGVDIAPSMIEFARKYNRRGEKCQYHLNTANDLRIFPDNSFDFIYTCFTLLHMAPEYSKNYIKEFLRVVRPGGLVIFQLPDKIPKKIRGTPVYVPPSIAGAYRRLKRAYFRLRGEPMMEGYWMERKEVEDFLNSIGARIVEIRKDPYTDPEWVKNIFGGDADAAKQGQATGDGWVSFWYCVAKSG